MKIAVIGAGWAGLAGAVSAVDAGHEVSVYEAAPAPGGRARSLAECRLPDGQTVSLDNGQHILIGAYTESLALMRRLGVDTESALLRMPLTLRFPDGGGLTLPRWPAPWDALWGIVRASGWSLAAKWSLLRTSLDWQRRGFRCAPGLSVQQLCAGLHPQILRELIAPLCVSALNTPADIASGSVFLRVLQDSLFAAAGGSNLLLPRVDLNALLPANAVAWLRKQAVPVHCGRRVQQLTWLNPGWLVHIAGQTATAFDHVVLATGASDAGRLLEHSLPHLPLVHQPSVQAWCRTAHDLQFEAITTVYAYGLEASLPVPMLALREDTACPAQFAFDRGQLGGPRGLIALVISASQGDRLVLQSLALAQAKLQLGLDLAPVKTITERHATFACRVSTERPPAAILPGLTACGDYVQGPYPATLEGAVRSAAQCWHNHNGPAQSRSTPENST
jgi:squalene-associated FAD-dependent desaturase